MEIHTVDISAAFLYGSLEHDDLMDLPEGWEALGLPGLEKHWVLQLVKAIYGLKQSPRQWHKKMDEILQLFGFIKIKSDSAIWIYRKEDVRIILPVYVDDMKIVAKSKSDVAHVIAELKKHADPGGL